MHSRLGPKRTLSEGTQEETIELDNLYVNLRQQLSLPRTDRLSGRALAVWDADQQAVCVLRKDGKFGNFGYSRDGKLFLENYEAIYLLEMGRLQLEYYTMIMSVEQAYLLLLGELASPRYNEYLVYSYLTRIGYILVRHQNVSYDNIEPTEVDCAWAIALSAINNHAIPDYVKKAPYYSKVKKKTKLIKECIMKQEVGQTIKSGCSSCIDFDRKITCTGKRKVTNDETDSPTEGKRRCIAAATCHKSLLNCLKDEPEYKKFQTVFERFDIIQLDDTNRSDEEGVRLLHITFDLYLHNNGFKKTTPKPPIFRLLILGVNDAFPTHAEITQVYNLQKCRVPLLIVSVGEAKQIHAFLYYFS